MEPVYPAVHRASPPYDRRQWVRQYLALRAVLRFSSGLVCVGATREVSLLNLFIALDPVAPELAVGMHGWVELTSRNEKSLELPCTVTRLDASGAALDLHGWKTAQGVALTADLLELLNGISGAVSSSLDLQTTLSTSVDHARAYLQAEAASLFLLENEGRELVCRACSGPVNILDMRIPYGLGVVGRVVEERRARIVMDVAEDHHFTPEVDQETGFVTRSLLCVPMQVNNERIGALELLNKKDGSPFDGEDQYVLSALAATAALSIFHARQATELVNQERRKEELKLARAIQESFMPAPCPEGFPIHGLNLSAYEISGDFYDILPLASGRIFFALGDVSGKGARAGLLMARASSLMRHMGRAETPPAELLRRVNLELSDATRMGMFVTAVAGYYDPADGAVVLANAGHNSPLLHHPDQNLFREWPTQDIPLGIDPGYTFQESRLILGEALLYLYSDGATEAVIPPQGDFLGLAGLQGLLAALRSVPPAQRLQAVVAQLRTPGQPLHDDVTLLLVDPSWSA